MTRPRNVRLAVEMAQFGLSHADIIAHWCGITEQTAEGLIAAARGEASGAMTWLTRRGTLAKLDPASIPQPRPERRPLPEAPMRSRGGRRARR
jgi:hypothetical protein